MLVAVFLFLLKPLTTLTNSDYPDCSDLSSHIIYGGNTSHKGLSNRQGFNNSDNMSECDLSGTEGPGYDCGDCDFQRIKPGEWYRFMLPHKNIAEFASSEIADKCPEVGQCNGRNQIILSKSDNFTRVKGSWFYRIVWSKKGQCRTMGESEDKDYNLAEKRDCSGFYLYRFPKLFAHSCGSGRTGDPWRPTSICMDDSEKLSPIWTHLIVAVSCALLLLIIALVAFFLYNLYRKNHIGEMEVIQLDYNSE